MIDIDRNVTFHLEKNIMPADALKQCVASFVDLLKSASSDLMSDAEWMASIEKGSVALVAFPTSEMETEAEIDECLRSIDENLSLLCGGKRPSRFSSRTISHFQAFARTLVEDGVVEGNPIIQVNSPSFASAPIVPGCALGKIECASANPAPIRAIGTAYGEVKYISVIRDNFFALYDERTGKKIKVLFDDALLDEVRRSLKRAIRVTGEVIYAENGEKKEMKAIEIEQGRANDTPVSFLDLFGVLERGQV